MNSKKGAPDRKTLTLKRLGRLLDLNQDIGRNARDTDFGDLVKKSVDDAHQIFYVFDENVFELFANPAEKFEFCANFYGKYWSNRVHPYYKSFSAQAGLIASEFLFSDRLPGLHPTLPIYMTEWHFNQLMRRLKITRSDFEREMNSTKRPNIEIEKARINELLRLEASLPDKCSVHDVLSRKGIAADLADDALRVGEAVRNQTEVGLTEAIDRFVRGRQIAELLVGDQQIEQLHQINRIYSEILPRVRPLASQFQPANRHEEIEQRDWILKFSDVLHNAKIRGRSREGVLADARSIGFIHWVARFKLNRNQRIVLVTGDNQVFEAYRRWYAEHPNEAFLLRRVNQYSPLLNPHAASNEINDAEKDDDRQVFARLRTALDAPMVTFNLVRRFADDRSQDAFDAADAPTGRLAQDPQLEHFAARLAGASKPQEVPSVSFYTDNLDEAWWLNREERFAELKTGMREAERVALGASYPVLEKRLFQRWGMIEEIQRRAAEGHVSSNVISDYMTSLLQTIATNALSYDIGHATAIMRDNLAKMGGDRTMRAPLNLELSVPTKDGFTADSFSTLMVRGENGDDDARDIFDPYKNKALEGRPDIIFAVGAVLMLRSKNWDEAERFAADAAHVLDDLAENLVLSPSGQGRSVIAGEYHYLQNLAKRFALANIEPPLILEGRKEHGSLEEDVWKQSLTSLVFALDDQERQYSGKNATAPEILRKRWRTIIERISARLFYVTWRAIQFTNHAGKKKAFGLIQSKYIVRQFECALRDFRAIWSALDGGDGAAMPDTLRVQLNINAAGFDLVKQVLDASDARVGLWFNNDELARTEAAMAALKPLVGQFPLIVGVDVFGFLTARRASKENLSDFRTWRDAASGSDLAIDRAWCQLLSGFLRA